MKVKKDSILTDPVESSIVFIGIIILFGAIYGLLHHKEIESVRSCLETIGEMHCNEDNDHLRFLGNGVGLDDWTAGVSDTQRYKQMGNAVTVNVIEAIVKRINNLT